MTVPITDESVAAILPILAERTRATERIASSFRPPQPGLLEEAGARRHQLIVGRRGVGTSMLLLNLIQTALNENQLVVFLDMETYRGIPYPDVLIHVLEALAGQLTEQLRKEQGFFRGWRLRRHLKQLRHKLKDLLADPHETRKRESASKVNSPPAQREPPPPSGLRSHRSVK